MNMNYKICFVCTGNACRSPFAECVTKKLLADAGMNGIEVFSLGTLDCGEYPRDAAMVDVAKELGYDLSGTTTVMTREKLMAADAVIVFDERHRDAITRVLDYSYWNKIVLFNKMASINKKNCTKSNLLNGAVSNSCVVCLNPASQMPPNSMGRDISPE